MDEQGYFTVDLAIAVIACLMIICLSLMQAGKIIEADEEKINEFRIRRQGLTILDSMIKNHDAENPLLGAAIYSEEKKRVESNLFDGKRIISNAKEINLGTNFVEGVYIESQNGNKMEQVFRKGEKCIYLERFGLEKNLGKAKIKLGICYE